MRDLTVGTRVARITGGHFAPTGVHFQEVVRVTPTGIAVLDNSDRLNPQRGMSGWEVRGEKRGPWDARRSYVLADDPTVAEAMECIRHLRLRTDVTRAHDAWTNSCGSSDATQALADAVSAWANRHPTP